MQELTDPISEFLGTATPAATGLDEARAAIEADMKALRGDALEASAHDDHAFVRERMRMAITKYSELIPSLVRVTEASESPQQYGAAASFFKVFGDMNAALLETAVKVKKVGLGPGGPGKALPSPGKSTSPDGVQAPEASGPGETKEPNDLLERLIMAQKKEQVTVVVES